MAYDFDAFLKKKGIKGDEYGVNIVNDETENSYDFDSVLDKIDSKAAGEQGYSLPEYRELQKKSQEAYERNKGIKKEKGFGDYAEDVVRGVAGQPFLRKATKGVTAGLNEPVAAGISSLIRKGMGDDKSLGEIYKDTAGNQREDLKRMEEEHPWQSVLGEIAGIAAPGGVFNRIYSGAAKATKLPNAVTEGLPLAKRLGLKVAQTGLRGGLTNLGFGALNELSSESISQDNNWNPVMDFLMGAAGDIVAMPAEKAIDVLSNSKNVKNLIEDLPLLGKLARGGREEAEAEAKRAFDNAKEVYRTNESKRMMQAEADAEIAKKNAVDSFKTLIQRDPSDAAQTLFKKIKDVDIKLGKEYGEIIDPIMNKYRLYKVDASPFRQEVDDILSRYGVIDETGKIDLKSMKEFLDFDPETKSLVEKLVSFRNGLNDDASISKLERGVKTLQKAAKFQKGAGYRSASEETLGDLSRRLKDFMTDQISQFASPEEMAAIQGAKAKFAEGKKTLKDPLKVIGRFESKPARIAVNLRSQFPDTTMQNLIKFDPSLKDEFSELFLNNLTSQSVSPRKFTKEIDYFGGRENNPDNNRELLKNILGEERFNQLETAEKNLHESAVPWKKKYVPDAPPQLKEIPPGDIEELYDALAKWAKIPRETRNYLGVAPIPMLASPFLSKALTDRN